MRRRAVKARSQANAQCALGKQQSAFQRRRQRQHRERQLHAEGIAQNTFTVPELEGPVPDDLLLRYANHRILTYLRSSFPNACFEWCEKRPADLIRSNGTGRIRLYNVEATNNVHVGGKRVRGFMGIEVVNPLPY